MSQHKTPKEHLVPDQVNAAIVGALNNQRMQDEILQLTAQDTAFSNALEQVDKVREFIGNPNNILGSELTKHGEIAEQVDGVKYHITSLNPIRPANVADAWEAEALRSFEDHTVQEQLSLVQAADAPIHRYMAPLLVKEACMKCHAAQGYKIGQVRGGISISMSAEKALLVREQQRSRALFLYGAGALVIAVLLHLVAWRSRRHFVQLHEIALGQEHLIAERTQELTRTNASLSAEIAERLRKEEKIRESEARYRSVIETSQNAILIVSEPDFRIVFANEQAAIVMALPIAAIFGQRLIDYVHPVDRNIFQGYSRQWHLAASGLD